MDIADWLRNLGLEQYEPAFRDNAIDDAVLPQLTPDDLKDIGVAQVGHRRKLLNAIAVLGDPAPAATPVAVDPISPTVTAAPSGGERRQLTVMFCDLVGSTALGEKLDPEELRSLLHAYRTLCGEVIARYDGFVARYVGDGILTYFGWPTAHEEDAERAVRAALEIVHTVKRASSTEDLSVRIGIATGPVVVGEQASTGDQSKLAVGSTPNLAARLQALATGGQIVIAASTRRLAGNAFELTDLGEHDLKGIAEPVHAWRVARALVTESRFDASRGGGALTPLVGREGEVDLLLERWSQAQDGEGQVVLLSGEPGIGKSRILKALRERLDAQGVQALRFQCSPYYVNSAFWPSIDNFERALEFARDETTDPKLDKLEALVVTHYGRPLADVRFVAAILSIPCEQRYGALPMTPQKHKDETLRTLVDITEAAARRQPSVMLFEDAHWADPTTLEVLDLLIDRVRTIPLLVVLTHRPEFQSRWSQQGHVGALNLSKLTRTQSAAMVSALAGGKALPAALLEQILTRTDGVPLFVEELTKSILESGELTKVGDHYEYAGSARAVTIPATLRDSLMARLDRFMPVKEVAQIGAAIGREFSYELIAAVAPLPQTQLDDSLVQLSASGLAFRRGTPPDAIYTFKHALVQDAAYDSLLKSRRQELHGKIARVIEARFPNIKTIEPEVLAHHLTAADLAEAAIPLWQAAGELASKRLVLTEAISHFNQGLELVATVSWSPERDAIELGLRSLLGTAWLALEGWATPEVWTSLHPWPTTPDRDAPRDNAASHIAELLARHWTEAGQIEKAAMLLGKAGQRSALVEAAEQLRRALDLVTTLPATPALRREEIKLQIALTRALLPIQRAAPETKAAVERARLLSEQAEARGEPPEDPLLLFSVLYGFWVANYVAFNGDVMRELAAQFVTLAGRQQTTAPRMIGHRLMGLTLLVTGDLAEAEHNWIRQSHFTIPRSIVPSRHCLAKTSGWQAYPFGRGLYVCLASAVLRSQTPNARSRMRVRSAKPPH
jgi:class 3 adenylate cyclase